MKKITIKISSFNFLSLRTRERISIPSSVFLLLSAGKLPKTCHIALLCFVSLSSLFLAVADNKGNTRSNMYHFLGKFAHYRGCSSWDTYNPPGKKNYLSEVKAAINSRGTKSLPSHPEAGVII